MLDLSGGAVGRQSRNKWRGQLGLVIAGLKKHMASKTLELGGKTMTVADIEGEFAALATAGARTAAAKSEWHQAVGAETTVRERRVKPLALILGDYLRGVYGQSNPMLRDFGITPRKAAKPAMKTRVAAIAKRNATRKARGTVGKRQRAKVKAQ